MFGTGNISPDYTFTQSEDRSFTNQASKIFSKYFGNFGVSKSEENKKSSEENLISQRADKLKENKSTDNLDKLLKRKNETEDNVIKLLGQGNKSDNDDISLNYPSETVSSSITKSFNSLAAAVGAIGGKISKVQLLNYLQFLNSEESEGASNEEIAFIKNLIAQFDTLSADGEYITSITGLKEPQDYTTITTEQVTPPVDVRV